jgi:ribose 5-phosphate isomerase A
VDSEHAGATDDAVIAWKRAAARAAATQVPDGTVVGLGSGSTAELFLPELAERLRAGLRTTGVPSSERTRTIAAGLGIPLVDLNDAPALDLSIDGADEVTLPQLELIKGRGGALLREKLVAASSRWRIIIVDSSKLVTKLGQRHRLPVEVIPFGWVHTARRLAALGCQPERRMVARQDAPQGAPTPYLTDSGHFILDCLTGPIANPETLAQAIKSQVGVVEHGLFVGMADRVIAAGPDGVRVHDRHG